MRQQMPTQRFHDGNAIPQLGFGVWQVPAEVTSAVVAQAVSTGFRSFDTAEAYYNELEVGTALANTGLPRDAFFITTKLWNTNQGRDRTLHAFDESMRRLGIETLDLYLMHWPSQLRDLYVETPAYRLRKVLPRSVEPTGRNLPVLFRNIFG
jgi:2,5-diketo-D-gluconate reductase A